MRTDHTELIADLRALDTVEDTAASDLLELHDRTSLNLHEAPRLLAFVEKRLAHLYPVSIKVRPNGV